MSSDSKIHTVPTVDGLTSEQIKQLLADYQEEQRQEAERVKARAAKYAALQAVFEAEAKANAGRIEAVRYETWKHREFILNPAMEENRRLVSEHTDLLTPGGAAAVPTDEKGERIEKKIRFSEDEVKTFTARYANEQAVQSKAAKAAK